MAVDSYVVCALDICKVQHDMPSEFHCCVSWADRVDVLLVEGPQLVPFLVGHVPGGTLSQHELSESWHSQASPQQTLSWR